MSYETVVTESGLVIAVDDIAGLGKIQVVKLDFGRDGLTSGPVALDNPLPVQVIQSGALIFETDRAIDANITNATLDVIPGATFPTQAQRHTKAYRSGVSGRVAIPAGKRISQLTCVASGVDASVVILGGDTIVVPANSGLSLDDIGQNGTNTAGDIVFTNTLSYYVDWEV